MTTPSPPDCGAIDVGSAQYGSHLSADRGRPGATVVLFGPTLRGENGRYAPASKVEAWWNWNNVPGGPPLDPGPVFLLATEPIQGRCAFQTSFKVPTVASGTYRIVVFVYSSEGFGLFGCHYFTVGNASQPTGPTKRTSLTDCAGIG